MKHPPSAHLRRYVLDEADAGERLSVEQHLRSCLRCRSQVEQQRRLDEWLAESCPVPDRPHGAREAFDRLWVEVERQDAQDRRQDSPRRLAGRRAAVWWAPLLAAAGLAALLWTVFARPAAHAPHEPGVAKDWTGSAAPAPAATTPADRGGLAVVDDPADRFDAGRLQSVRDSLAGVLTAAAARHPHDDVAFADSCAGTCRALRAGGWPVPSLLRRLAEDADATLADAALRLACTASDCDATLADALGDTARQDVVLDRLVAAPERPFASVLVTALAAIGSEGDAAADLPRRLRAVTLLARDGQPASRTALARVLDLALRAAADGPAGGQAVPAGPAWSALVSLADILPRDLATTELLEAGARASTRDIAAACFAHVARGDAEAAGVALDRLLPRLPAGRRSLAAQWAEASALRGALPGLCAALAEQPDDAELLSAITSLGGADAAGGLAAVLLAERGRPTTVALQDALVSCVLRDPDGRQVPPAIARALALSPDDELLALVHALPAERRGALLLAALDVVPALPAQQARREGLLTALACDGSAEDGQRLVSWIDTRPASDRLLALAWTTAYRLSGAEAAGAWEVRGHDPALLVEAGRDCGAWPHAAPAPPARRQRPLDDTLRRASRASSPTASVLKETF